MSTPDPNQPTEPPTAPTRTQTDLQSAQPTSSSQPDNLAPAPATTPTPIQTDSKTSQAETSLPAPTPLQTEQQLSQPNYALQPPSDPHQEFCNLVGIYEVPSKTSPKYKPWTSTLVARIDKAYRRQKWEYRVTAALSSSLLLLQVFIGAIVTALGASNSPHIVIAVFGAVNTVIAGVITYLQGRGQPTRSRAYRDSLAHCVNEIQDTEAAFLGVSNKVNGYGPDTSGMGVKGPPAASWSITVRSEVERLTELYEQAQEDARRNYPDLWVKAGEGQVKSKTQRILDKAREDERAARSAEGLDGLPNGNLGHGLHGQGLSARP